MKLKGKESKIISKSQPSSSESPADAPTDLKAGGMVEQSFPPKETRLLLVAGTQSGVGKVRNDCVHIFTLIMYIGR